MFTPTMRAISHKLEGQELKDYFHKYTIELINKKCYHLYDAKKFIDSFKEE
jgi:hypothetical protein